jgi:cell division protein FtsL
MVCFTNTLTIFILTDLEPAATIAQLKARKQRYKLKMFTRLYRILLLTVVIIAVFFVISSLSFSDRLAEGNPELTE